MPSIFFLLNINLKFSYSFNLVKNTNIDIYYKGLNKL